MSSPLFVGLATALVTPFTDEGVNFDTLARMVDMQKKAGAAAVVVCGTTGEAATMSQQEKNDVLTLAVREAAGSMKVIAGIGGNNTLAAAEAAHEAERRGADALMLSTPYYNKANKQGIVAHFSYVADRCSVPLILYNVPGRTVVQCTEEIYGQLADHPRICGIKEASGDLALASQTMNHYGEKLTLWSGNDDQTLPLMALGAKGVISVASNIIPKEMAALCQFCLKDEWDKARILHRKYEHLFSALFSDINPIPVKTAMNWMGLNAGPLRLPLCAMEHQKAEMLRHCLKESSLLA